MLTILRLRMLKFKDDYPIMLIMTVLAIAFSFVFSLSQGGEVGLQTVGIVDDAGTAFSQEVVEKIQSSGDYRLVFGTREDIREALQANEVPFSLYFPESFNLENREIVIFRAIESMEGLQAENKLLNLIDATARTTQLSETIAEAFPALDAEVLKTRIESDLERWPTYTLTTFSVGRGVWEDFDYMMHLLIGFSVMFSMYTMIFGMGDILTDKKLLTYQRVMVSPLSSMQFLTGHLVSSMFFGFVQMTIVLGVGKYLFGIDWGQNLLGILLVVLSFIFTVSAMGLMLSSLVRTMGQLGAISPIIITGTAMIGGCMWPLEIVNSKILLFLSNLTPQKWAMSGIKNLAMYNLAFESILKPVGILIAMGILFIVVGLVLMRRSELSFSR